jgi:hypothetical protein
VSTNLVPTEQSSRFLSSADCIVSASHGTRDNLALMVEKGPNRWVDGIPNSRTTLPLLQVGSI